LCIIAVLLIISKAVFANIENQITDAIVGMKIVVIKNSFIVLPLDILAIKPQWTEPKLANKNGPFLCESFRSYNFRETNSFQKNEWYNCKSSKVWNIKVLKFKNKAMNNISIIENVKSKSAKNLITLFIPVNAE
jgi:hypothetical protein